MDELVYQYLEHLESFAYVVHKNKKLKMEGRGDHPKTEKKRLIDITVEAAKMDLPRPEYEALVSAVRYMRYGKKSVAPYHARAWAMHYAGCRLCGTVRRRHKSHGLCTSCYRYSFGYARETNRLSHAFLEAKERIKSEGLPDHLNRNIVTPVSRADGAGPSRTSWRINPAGSSTRPVPYSSVRYVSIPRDLPFT